MAFVRLKELRQERKLTQQDISDSTKISRSVLSQYENGLAEPTLNVIIRLADFFDVSTDFLIGRTDDTGNIVIQGENNFPTSLLEQRLILDFRKLPADTQNNFAALFHNLATGG